MHHKAELMKYFGKYHKMADAIHSVKSDLKKVKEAYKEDYFPEAPPELLDNSLSDEDFLKEFTDKVKLSFPDKLASVVLKIIGLAEAFDYNIFDFVKMRERYCEIKEKMGAAYMHGDHTKINSWKDHQVEDEKENSYKKRKDSNLVTKRYSESPDNSKSILTKYRIV